jgi:leucyl-tRNA synthetase
MMGARDPQTGQTPKMSKSAGNVVTPDSVVESHGADALRVYLLFMAPFENSTVWEVEGINGAYRFVQRVWRFVRSVIGAEVVPSSGEMAERIVRAQHRIVKRVTEDIEAFKFNTAVAAMMEYLNDLTDFQQTGGVTAELVDATQTFIKLLAPFAPFITEELWANFGGDDTIHRQPWPQWEAALTVDQTVTLIVQVDGRVRDRITVPVTIDEAEARTIAEQTEGAQRYIDGRQIARVIYVPNRLVNIVTK